MRRGFNRQKEQVHYRINGQIFARELRVLDGAGKQVGILARNDALAMAQDQSLDLVEIAPTAQPPVAKLIDYSKFLYQLKKKKQVEKKGAKTGETKQIQFGPFIDDHDLEIKLRRGREFIQEGNKVRFVVRFKGRAITRKEMGEEVLKKVIERMSEVAKVEREIRMEGRQMVLIMSKGTPKPKEEVVAPQINNMTVDS